MEKLLLNAALGKQGKKVPVWFLRQAGRYLPEYRELREKAGSFLNLCQNPKLAAEITMQPLRRFDLDAAIIFSDILIPCLALGQTLTFDKGHGPVLTEPVRSAADVKKLREPQIERDVGYVGQALTLTKGLLAPHQTLIGFAGAPLTVASYMIEGSSSKDYSWVRRFRYNEPEAFGDFLMMLAGVTVQYLEMQVRAGAECLMLFDSWASQFGADDYREFEVPAMKHIVTTIKQRCKVPVIYYPGGGSDLYNEIGPLNDVDVVAVDWRVPMDRAINILKSVGVNKTVQGNLDPQALVAPEAFVRKRTRQILEQGCAAKGHIFNVGHGLVPSVPYEALQWAISEVRKFERKS
ncbi:MAG: uroporphyrinogen decarboxylase [Oligoflexales bacterium]